MLSFKCVGGSQTKRVAGEGDLLEKVWKPIPVQFHGSNHSIPTGNDERTDVHRDQLLEGLVCRDLTLKGFEQGHHSSSSVF